jgi:hypothetical protein
MAAQGYKGGKILRNILPTESFLGREGGGGGKITNFVLTGDLNE